VKEVKEKDLNYKKTKRCFDRLVKKDQFKDLTLTYDFEAEVAKIKGQQAYEKAILVPNIY
jgi:hypothetical protein